MMLERYKLLKFFRTIFFAGVEAALKPVSYVCDIAIYSRARGAVQVDRQLSVSGVKARVDQRTGKQVVCLCNCIQWKGCSRWHSSVIAVVMKNVHCSGAGYA